MNDAALLTWRCVADLFHRNAKRYGMESQATQARMYIGESRIHAHTTVDVYLSIEDGARDFYLEHTYYRLIAYSIQCNSCQPLSQ
jgi:hypothetical protein